MDPAITQLQQWLRQVQWGQFQKRLVEKLFLLSTTWFALLAISHRWWQNWSGAPSFWGVILFLAAGATILYTWLTKPSLATVAHHLDRELNTQNRLASALDFSHRPHRDPEGFAQAAVDDAWRCAQTLDWQRVYRFHLPPAGYVSLPLALLGAAFLVAFYQPQLTVKKVEKKWVAVPFDLSGAGGDSREVTRKPSSQTAVQIKMNREKRDQLARTLKKMKSRERVEKWWDQAKNNRALQKLAQHLNQKKRNREWTSKLEKIIGEKGVQEALDRELDKLSLPKNEKIKWKQPEKLASQLASLDRDDRQRRKRWIEKLETALRDGRGKESSSSNSLPGSGQTGPGKGDYLRPPTSPGLAGQNLAPIVEELDRHRVPLRYWSGVQRYFQLSKEEEK